MGVDGAWPNDLRDSSPRLDSVLVGRHAQGRMLRADPGPIRALLTIATAAAALSVAGAGLLVLSARQTTFIPHLGGDNPAGIRLGPDRQAAREPSPTAPLERVARTPQAAEGTETYAGVVAALARGDRGALPRLASLAEGGDAQAQLRLASLFEAGDGGVERDLAAARRWTRMAAERGERVAMHNLALYLMGGEGGPSDFAEAATWFRRAADLGVVDSQYNLGLLYEAGRGVPKSLREAYRWFAVAANAGDLAARAKQVELEAMLKPAERADLDREASAFRPGADAGVELALVIPPAGTLAETQALLSRQGYYLGPIDGVVSPAFRVASAAYLRDHPGVTPIGVSAP